ncbi:MAG: VCBS repeat-containing protein [Vicinamibacterales bacterium]
MLRSLSTIFLRGASVAVAVFSLTLVSPASAQQVIGGCSVLPANNIWNTPINTLPVASSSATLVNTIGATRGFHADFGSGVWDGGPIGIPFVTVPGSQTKYPATFDYAEDSDKGPYAVPLTAPIEGGSASTGDRHAIAIDTTNCILYELYYAFPGASSWTAGSGAIFDLKSNALRTAGWTSADAAGLPIVPGLITYDEVLTGEIKHAIRFTAPQTRNTYVWPARHQASSLTGAQYPRMGERFRLKASFDITPYPADVQTILKAMKKYGLILADNGSSWYISGAPDPRWNNDNLATLGNVLGSNLEVVDATVLMVDPNSGATNGSTGSTPPPPPSVPNPVPSATPPTAGSLAVVRPGDFDGDRKADVTLYRPSSGSWYLQRSSGTTQTYGWGLLGDVPAPGDYDGDGKLDLAVYRPSNGGWYICWSSNNFATFTGYPWGAAGDVPVPGDYDGDGKTDVAVYRPSTGGWWVLKSSTRFANYANYPWGAPGDVPVAADYDGDGKADPAVYRPSTGGWWILKSSTNYSGYATYLWGLGGDQPVVADYDGDGKADPAIYRPTTGGWWILKSGTGFTGYMNYAWGLPGDAPVVADYDGDGKADPAIYRVGTGAWWILKTSNGTYGSYTWGTSADIVVMPRN